MNPPAIEREPMMILQVTLRRVPIGQTPMGQRVEVWFDGVATSPHWDGEWTVSGIDHITVGSNGIARIDVHTIITNGDDVVTYRGNGRGGAGGVCEGVIFETASERLAWMNEAVAVGRGTIDADHLTISLYRLTL